LLRRDEASPANSAYAKIIKVYPFINRQNFKWYTNDQLLKVPAVKEVLGTQIEIQAQTASDFHRQLQHYVDSGEPVEDANSTTPSTHMR